MRSGLRRGVLGVLCAAGLLAATSPEAPVADAAMRGDLEGLRALVRQGADVNAAQGDGMTGLHWAAERGDVEMARLLVYAGARARAVTRLGGHTPLHIATRGGHAEVTRVLIEAGSPVDAPTSTGVTPLHFAATSGDVGTVTLLLDRGARVDATEDATDQTPLMFAAAAGRVAVLQALLARGADLSAVSRTLNFVARSQADQQDRQRRTRLLAAAREAEEGARAAAAPGTGGRGGGAGGAPPAEEAPPAASGGARAGAPAEPGAERPAADARPDAPRPADAEPDSTGRPERPEGERPGAEQRAAAEEAEEAPAQGGGARGFRRGGGGASEEEEEEARPLSYADLVGSQGGLTALHFAVRQGHLDAVRVLLDAGSEIDRPTEGDNSTPLLIATINGHYDLAMFLLERGADPNVASDAGATPLYTTLNNRWAPKALYPQPTAFQQQQTSYLDLVEALLVRGADPNARLSKHLWYTSYNFDLLGVDMQGATPFWRAAYATDVPAMRLLVAYGADPGIPTSKPPQRAQGPGAADREDASGLPEIPVGGPAVYPIHAASGVGYGQEYAANAHRHAPGGWLPAIRYLVEELGADVNARDHNGYNALHHAASRGDNELILYLVENGADVTAVSRRGQTTADMANGPQQRVLPYPETVALLESLGSKNNNNCVGC